ncbi:hypothetical protein [Arthrobacter sp. H14]|uniref:hypothetical protein n=1 Tax=Arthrobacter sp. H14 TaxID=1312959 RepID=UPI0004B93F6C|nr:hypothetical protein [Arthrobacter sp. H14]
MLQAVIRRPTSVGELAADGVRAVGVLSLVGAVIWLSLVDVAVLLLVLLGLLIARSLRLRPSADIATGVILLTAAWSSITNVYEAIEWWDFLIHAATTGVLAGISHLLVLRTAGTASTTPVQFMGQGAVTGRGAVVYLITAQGVALSVLWEFGEWWGYTYVDAAINVGYRDTLGDLAAGALGAVVCGAIFAWSAASGRRVHPDRNRTAA